ncbi:dynamin [Scytonema hofmannii PCC 7110]|uniref:Dynamin n=1 Tax=Scytonema hofmannii PCC 7110 TaxID=128403 RepID=A0A139X095_9CYAN|nr:dynamin family protein [Scytonema hofmannii]KYC38108.1 dynamin [Scytonema hofmannii PCC 7110]
MKSYLTISQSLKAVCQFIDAEEQQQLVKDVELVCQQLVNPHFGIAVLAPFNFGKSTLINALLGREIMPTKMVRTTGTVIKIKYGETLQTLITLKSGEVIRSNDTEVLKEFAVLNHKRQRREDVMSVEVAYPSDLLKNGIELFDLPGTNDKEEQNVLVRNQLLQVDLVIQVLNAQQPFTLGEQETLSTWLINRGIKSVIFVLNRMNEIESEDDKNEIYDDVYSTTAIFKSDLPQGLKTLYRVDALPAVKAKQERNIWKRFISGIITFKATLLTVTFLQKKRTNQTRLLRVITIATQIKQILQKKVNDLTAEIRNAEEIRNVAIKQGKERELFLKKEFKRRLETYRNWLSLNSLVGTYQRDAAESLETNRFHTWQDSKLKSTILTYTQAIEKWVNQSCDELNINQINTINISLPSYPNVVLPQPQDRNARQWIGDIFNGGANRKRLNEEYQIKKWEAYKNAVYKYLSKFSKDALMSLDKYEKTVESLIIFPIPPVAEEVLQKRHHLNALNSSLDAIKSIELLKSTIDTHRFKGLEHLIVFLLFWKNWLWLFFG